MIGRRKIGGKDREDEMDRVNSLARFVKRMLNFFIRIRLRGLD